MKRSTASLSESTPACGAAGTSRRRATAPAPRQDVAHRARRRSRTSLVRLVYDGDLLVDRDRQFAVLDVPSFCRSSAAPRLDIAGISLSPCWRPCRGGLPNGEHQLSGESVLLSGPRRSGAVDQVSSRDRCVAFGSRTFEPRISRRWSAFVELRSDPWPSHPDHEAQTRELSDSVSDLPFTRDRCHMLGQPTTLSSPATLRRARITRALTGVNSLIVASDVGFPCHRVQHVPSAPDTRRVAAEPPDQGGRRGVHTGLGSGWRKSQRALSYTSRSKRCQFADAGTTEENAHVPSS